MMTKTRLLSGVILLTSLLGLLSGCPDPVIPPPDGNDGHDGPAMKLVIGEINSTGHELMVNGQPMDTHELQVFLDGEPGVLEDLKVGMRVKVEAEVDVNGDLHGQHLEFDDDVIGPIDPELQPTFQTNLAAGRLSVMGQTVRLDDGTMFDSCTVGDLAPDQVLVISGARDDNGLIHASLVHRRGVRFDDLPENEQELEVRGTIANLDAAIKTFKIGTLTVDFSQAALDAAINAAGGPANGMMVEVRSDQPLVTGVLIATSISLEDDPFEDLEDGQEVRIEGLVTAVTSATEFSVDGYPVSTTAETVFKRGTAADISVGRVLEVEGELDANGVLMAHEVSFELAKNVKIEGAPVMSIDPAAQTVTVLDIEVAVDAATRVKDKSDANLDEFTLADLQVGDTLRIRAFIDAATGEVTAAKLERDEPRPNLRVLVQGPLEADTSTAAVLRILGAAIDTSAITQFRDVNGNNLADAAAFLQAALADPQILLKVQGALQPDGSVTWERAELETQPEFQNEVENEFEFEFEFENGIENPFED